VQRALTESTPVHGTVRVLSVGKAAHAMARAAVAVLGRRIAGGLIVGHVAADVPSGFQVVLGTHPVPDEASERAGRAALTFAASVPADQSLLLLLSGGGSAIMAVPADGVRLADKRATTDRLLKAGADIYALNTVRKHISAVKGGRLAVGARSPCVTLAISDVVGDDLSVIASGPGVPDASTFSDALDVLVRFGGLNRYPASVVARLRAGARGEVPETPKPGDPRLARASALVIGGRRDAMDGAANEAASRGYDVVCFDDAIVGEARTASADHLKRLAARAAGLRRPTCFISSGETTVTVTGGGKGGRNQEFALAAAAPLAALPGPAVLISAGTDGIDGPTDAAGGLVDSTTVARCAGAGLGSPADFLADNNAYALLAALDDLVVTGPTDTNVGDLQVALLGL
jgi:glycerate 2-kinase